MIRVADNQRGQARTQVPLWLATSTDTADLNEVLNVYGGFGSAAHAGLFWAVRGVGITAVSGGDATHANVTLSGDIVWCLGLAPNDATATCSAVNGIPGRTHTHSALSVDGRWKVDIDINASSQLDTNPQVAADRRSAHRDAHLIGATWAFRGSLRILGVH